MNDAELVKSKIDIVDYLSGYISLRKAGRNFKACCQFHSEKTPSFIVSPERQSWHCFGACAEGGDVIKFLQKWENLEFLEALQILAKKAGVTLSHYAPTDETRQKEKLFAINHLASEFYHYILMSHKLGIKTRNYLKERKIKDETIKTFMIGYAPQSWDSLYKFLIRKSYSAEDIYTAGLLIKGREGHYYDRFRGRLIFTLRDHRGNTVGFSGRVLPPYPEKEAKYINTSDTPVYIKGNTLYGLDITRESIKKQKEAVVVEGEFDMLSSFQSGVANVIAIKGSALTEGQVLLLKRYTENLVLALDSDFAGNEAARRGIDIAESANLSVRVIDLPFGKDPAECIAKDQHLWEKAIKEAVPVYDFVINNAFKKFEGDGVLGKKKIGNEIVPYLSKINNPIVLSHYVKKVAKKLEVTEESIEALLSQYQRKQQLKTTSPQAEYKHESRLVMMEEYFLSLIIQSKETKKNLEKATDIISSTDFNSLVIKQIMENLVNYFKGHDEFKVKEFGKSLTPEAVPTFDHAYLSDIERIIKDSDLYTKELILTVSEIKKMSIRRSINDLTTKIKHIEEKGEEQDIKDLNNQLRQKLEQLNQVDKSVQKN